MTDEADNRPRTPDEQRKLVRDMEREHWRRKHELHDEADRQAMTRLINGETP